MAKKLAPCPVPWSADARIVDACIVGVGKEGVLVLGVLVPCLVRLEVQGVGRRPVLVAVGVPDAAAAQAALRDSFAQIIHRPQASAWPTRTLTAR